MKTRFIALVFISIFSFQFSMSEIMAQRPSDEDMQARRTEAVEKRADKLAKDFGLKDSEKKSFVETYKAFQAELQGVQQDRRVQYRNGDRNEEGEKKKLTDEEAQKQIDEYFARQEKQIEAQQKRLAIEKKYYAELGKKLTAKQLVKIFHRQGNNRPGNMQRPGGYSQQGGGHGGGFPGGGHPGSGFEGDF